MQAYTFPDIMRGVVYAFKLIPFTQRAITWANVAVANG